MMNKKTHRDYQREYRKHKMIRVIIFSQNEYRILQNAAQEQQKPFSTFVRELALAQVTNQYVLPNAMQTKSVQLLLTRIGTNVNQIAHLANATLQISSEKIQSIQKHFSKIEEGIMDIYKKPVLVEDIVRASVKANPDYLKRIETVLKEFS